MGKLNSETHISLINQEDFYVLLCYMTVFFQNYSYDHPNILAGLCTMGLKILELEQVPYSHIILSN